MFGKEIVNTVLGISVGTAVAIMLISIFFYAANAGTSALPKLDNSTVIGQIYYGILGGFKTFATYIPVILILGGVGLIAVIAIALYNMWSHSGVGAAGGRTRQLRLVPAVPKVYVVYAKIPARFFYWF
jgi:hypothetical protein